MARDARLYKTIFLSSLMPAFIAKNFVDWVEGRWDNASRVWFMHPLYPTFIIQTSLGFAHSNFKIYRIFDTLNPTYIVGPGRNPTTTHASIPRTEVGRLGCLQGTQSVRGDIEGVSGATPAVPKPNNFQ
jgi:hypothetical protein